MKHLNHFLVLILLLFIVFLFTACASPSVNSSTNPPTTIAPVEPSETTMPEPTFPNPPELDYSFEYIPNLSREDNIVYRCRIEGYLINLFSVLADMDIHDPEYLEKTEPITALIQELQALDQRYLEDYLAIEAERERWEAKKAEYPVATEVWLYMINEMGYSEIVAAGIMGNMMAECGGLTLKLNWTATNPESGCYGLCQWHPEYHIEVQGADLQGQLEYMKKSFPKSMSQQWALDGYKKGFTYEEFLALQDIEEAAKAFCLIYERPGGYNPKRGDYALQAFRYFTTPVAPIDIA